MIINCTKPNGDTLTLSLEELLPHSFGPEDLEPTKPDILYYKTTVY